MAAADFDGDGNPDVASIEGNRVAAHFTDGFGSVVSTTSFPTLGTGVERLVTADFSGDEEPDIVTVNSGSDDISVLRSEPDGVLGAPTRIAAGGTPRDLVPGDFDDDGDLDLAVSATADDQILWFAGRGDGTFAAAVAHPVGDQPRALAVGDFDGDDRLDLAVGRDGSPAVDLLFGRAVAPDGTVFEAPLQVPVGAGEKVLAAGNLNADGLTDLGVLDRGSTMLTVVRGDFTRSFLLATQPFGTSTPPEDLAFGDFDGDGFDDLVIAEDDVSTTTHEVVVRPGDGHGGFAVGTRLEGLTTRNAAVLPVHLGADAELDIATTGSVFLGDALAFDPEFVEFPARSVGTPGPLEPVVVENIGTAPYEVVATGFLDGAGQFTIETDTCAGAELEVGDTCTVELSFRAAAPGVHEDVFVVETETDVYGIDIVGEGVGDPVLAASPVSVQFPEVVAGTMSSATTPVRVTNQGEVPVTVGDLTFGGADPGAFGQVFSDCVGATLAPGASCGVPVFFQPVRGGPHSATLHVSHDGQGGTLTVPLSGTATPPFTLSAGAVDFGRVEQGTVATRSIVVNFMQGPPGRPPPRTRLAGAEATVTGADASAFGSPRSCRSALGTCTLAVTFSPLAARRHGAILTVAAGGYSVVVPLAGTGALPPTPNVSAKLRARLRAALRSWSRGGRAAALRRGLTVTGIRTAVRGSLRLVVRRAGGPVLARGRAQARTGESGKVSARLTRAGRRALSRRRSVRVVATLELRASQDGRRSRARAPGLLR